MNAKEYLEQAYILDNMIESNIREVENLRRLARSLSSPSLTERVLSSSRKESPFVRAVEKIVMLEEKINTQIDTLVDLKVEIESVICSLKNTEHMTILRGRYIERKSWQKIAEELYLDPKTVRRHHNKALESVVLPVDPTSIKRIF